MSGATGDNLELIRGGYEAWNHGDVEGVAAILDEEVEWHGHPRLPEPGPFFGREAVKGWLADLRVAWEEISVHPLAYAETGDRVVVLVHFTGRGRGSGLEVQSGIDAHVWRLAKGRVVEMRWIQGDKVAQRLGVPPDRVRAFVADASDRLTVLVGEPSA